MYSKETEFVPIVWISLFVEKQSERDWETWETQETWVKVLKREISKRGLLKDVENDDTCTFQANFLNVTKLFSERKKDWFKSLDKDVRFLLIVLLLTKMFSQRMEFIYGFLFLQKTVQPVPTPNSTKEDESNNNKEGGNNRSR